MESIAAIDYCESGRLSFEIRSALWRAETSLDRFQGDDSRAAEIIADIAEVRTRLAELKRDLAALLRAAPVLDEAGAGSEERERDWKHQRTSASARAPSWADDLATLAPRLGLGAVDLRNDETARAMTDASGARGVALGDTVYLHPDRIQPGTTEGREVLAHELIHLAQARLPASGDVGADQGRDDAELEAAQLARQLAHGGAIGAPRAWIDLSRAAADRHGEEALAKVDPELTLPADRNIQPIPGADAVLVRSAWLRGTARPDATLVDPTRMLEVLVVLRTAGRLAWATAADLAELGRQPHRLSAAQLKPVIRLDLSAGSYHVLGLPDGVGAIVSVRGGGVEVTMRLRDTDPAHEGQSVVLDDEAISDISSVLESKLEMSARADAVDRFKQLGIARVQRHGAVHLQLSDVDLQALFDEEQWKLRKTGGGGRASERAPVAIAGTSRTSPDELTADEQAWLAQWGADHLTAGTGGGGLSRRELELARKIDASPHREAIYAWIRGGSSDRAVDPDLLERAFHEGTYAAERAARQLDPEQSNATAERTPYFEMTLPAQITQHGGLVIAGDAVPLEIVIDWPAETLSALDQLARHEQDPFRVEVEWVFAGPGGRSIEHSTATGAIKHSHRFTLPLGESAGTWTVFAFVRSSYFYPTAVPPTQIEVKTKAARMADLNRVAMADLGTPIADPYVHGNLAGGGIADLAGRPDDHLGRELHGDLPADFVPRSDDERTADRAGERRTLQDLRTYLSAQPYPTVDAIEALDRSLARLDELDKAIAADRSTGWQSFEVRGAFLSRRPEIPSGSLDVLGGAKWETIANQAGAWSGVKVRLRDLSKRADAHALSFEGEGDTFAEAFQRAFLDLCKTYPDGTLSLLAEELQVHDAAPVTRTGKTLGFELGTTTGAERIKEAVWTPVLNTLVDAVATAVMIFAPVTAPLLFPLLAAYHSIQTVDGLMDQARRGTLDTTKTATSLLSIGLDFLPLLQRAVPIASRRGLSWAIEGLDHGASTVLMTHDAYLAARDLQEGDIAAMATAYQQLIELERTGHASDPRVAQARQEIEDRARELRGRTFEQFTSAFGRTAIFRVAAHQFQRIQRQVAETFDTFEPATAASAPGTGKGPRVPTTVGDAAVDALTRSHDEPDTEQHAQPSDLHARAPDPKLVAIAQKAYAKYAAELETAKADLRSMMGDLGEVEGRAKGPVSAANRLQRAIDNFGAKVTDVDSAIANLWDAVGTRIVIDKPTPQVMVEVVKRISDAITSGRLKVTMASNLHGKDGLPYLTSDQMQSIAQVARAANGAPIEIHQHKILDGGFTSVALYIELPGGVRGELQIIGRQAMDVAAVEHIPYDVTLGKPLVRDIDPTLESELRSIVGPVENAIRVVNADPALKAAYVQYFSGLYRYARQLEVGEAATLPPLPAGIDTALSFDGLRKVRDAVEALKTRRSNVVPSLSGLDPKGVPTTVPLDREELRAHIASKHRGIVDKYAAAQRTTRHEYDALLADLRQYGPGELGRDKNARKAKRLLERFAEITKTIESETGASEAEELRSLYNMVERDEFPRWQAESSHLPSERRAQLAHMHREELRVYIRDLMTDMNAKEALYLRDLALYGHREGPTFDELLENAMSDSAIVGTGSDAEKPSKAHQWIVESSMRSDKNANRGLVGNDTGIKAAIDVTGEEKQ